MAGEFSDSIIIPVREEQLRTKSRWVQTAEINCHKEVVSEDIIIQVPLKREELVIEKRLVAADSPEQASSIEITRIPLREERLEILKYTFDLEKVTVFKQKITENKSIYTPLKKEVVITNTTGVKH